MGLVIIMTTSRYGKQSDKNEHNIVRILRRIITVAAKIMNNQDSDLMAILMMFRLTIIQTITRTITKTMAIRLPLA